MSAALRQVAAETKSLGLVDGEYVLTTDDFHRIATMLLDHAGIVVTDSKATLVYSRLAKRLRALGLRNFREYCDLIASPDGGVERQNMVAALTTNVTRFFREPHHFDDLRDRVLPPLIEAARRGGRVRIWSAACSSGQEPYSAAMTILSSVRDAANLDIKILATDIDPNMVADGQAGIYPESLLDAVPPEMRRRWFSPAPDGSGMRIADEVRALVSFRELNLIGDWPMRGKFQAIFCRNVVIYFGEDTQARIWSRFAAALEPGGTLYIGHSERVAGAAAQLFTPDGITTYRLHDGARK